MEVEDAVNALRTRELFDEARASLQPKTKFAEAFDTAMMSVTQEREEDYGSPSVDFARAAKLKAVVAECVDPPLRHAMEMICVKLARLIHSPDHLDSWIDIAGYARTACMVIDETSE